MTVKIRETYSWEIKCSIINHYKKTTHFERFDLRLLQQVSYNTTYIYIYVYIHMYV